MILFKAELQFMNGEVRANIHVRRMPENQQAPLFFPKPRFRTWKIVGLKRNEVPR
jgi:hypothetical protein